LAAARAIIALARSDVTGIINVGGPERLSRLEIGERLARFLKLSSKTLTAGRRNVVAGSEPRPRDVALDTSLWRSKFPDCPMPAFDAALADMLTL